MAANQNIHKANGYVRATGVVKRAFVCTNEACGEKFQASPGQGSVCPVCSSKAVPYPPAGK